MELSINNKPSIVLAGSVTTRSGYGSHSRDIARALIKSGKYDVKIVPIRWGATPQDALDPQKEDDKIILDRLISGQLKSQPDYYIHVTIPNEFQRVGKYNIGITAGIETTICRTEWIEGCNRMDLVLGTSKHTVDVFKAMQFEKRDTATQRPIGQLTLSTATDVLFEGVDTNIFNKRINRGHDIVKMLDEIDEDFCFLFVGHWLQGDIGHDRKDIGMLIKTFIETFKRKQKQNRPALILKTSQAGFSIMEYTNIYQKIADIRNACRAAGWSGELPNIYVIEGSLTDEEMNSMYNHAKIKAMVSFTKGEGYGRPLLEFTTTGKPVIASGWSGQLDFLDPEYCVLLPGQLSKVHPSAVNDWILPESQWFTVNYPIASQRLLDVHKNYKKYLELSTTYRGKVVKKFSLDTMQEKLCDYIDNIETYKNKHVLRTASPQQKQINLPQLSVVKSEQSPQKLSLPKLKKVEL